MKFLIVHQRAVESNPEHEERRLEGDVPRKKRSISYQNELFSCAFPSSLTDHLATYFAKHCRSKRNRILTRVDVLIYL